MRALHEAVDVLHRRWVFAPRLFLRWQLPAGSPAIRRQNRSKNCMFKSQAGASTPRASPEKIKNLSVRVKVTTFPTSRATLLTLRQEELRDCKETLLF